MLSTAYEQPVDPHALTKIRRAIELWNGGEKAFGAIHLAFVRLPPCTPQASLRLFAAEQLMESGLAPETLMKCQGFDTAPLSLLKYSPDQPRDDHGRWTSGERSGGATGLQEGRSVSNGGGGNEKDQKYEEERRQGTESRKEDIEHGRPVNVLPPGLGAGERGGLPYIPQAGTEHLQLPKIDSNKLRHIFGDPGHELDELVHNFGSKEAAFHAIANATRNVLQEKKRLEFSKKKFE